MVGRSGGLVTVAPGTLRNYAELGRISNLPTCWTNVLVGCSIGALSGDAIAYLPVLTVMFAISCFYVAGMAMNDLFDVEIDRVERPERPIPSGRITRHSANLFATSGLVLGLAALVPVKTSSFLFGLVLAVVILAYNWLHKKHDWTVILMGICRGLVYLVAASAVAWPLGGFIGWWLATSISLYTVVITLVARTENESDPGKRRYLGLVMWPIVFGPILVAKPASWAIVLLTVLLIIPWSYRAIKAASAKPPRTKDAVLTWLSGMCLVDALYLAVLGQPLFPLLSIGAFGITALGHRRILGT